MPFTIKNNAEFKTKEIKNITDITGFLEIITKIAEEIALIINSSINKLFTFKYINIFIFIFFYTLL
jgi:hypothetical protein